MAIRTIESPAILEPFLRRNPFLHLYALGDLDPRYWPHTRWYGLDRHDLEAVVLLYTAYATPTLMALGDPPLEALHELLRLLRPSLPEACYAHLSAGCLAALGPGVTSASRGRHLKMALSEALPDVPLMDRVERLSMADEADLRALYAAGYPANWLDPVQIETGHYYGLRDDGHLVAAAGPHVFSARRRVVALGNIVTHPDCRGRGYAAAVTARLCQEVRPHVDHIGLNVHAENDAALACYKRLGFRPVAEYEETRLTLRAAE